MDLAPHAGRDQATHRMVMGETATVRRLQPSGRSPWLLTPRLTTALARRGRWYGAAARMVASTARRVTWVR